MARQRAVVAVLGSITVVCGMLAWLTVHNVGRVTGSWSAPHSPPPEIDVKRRPLVYDIGFHRGEDTFMYLQHGYRVVAVEANPELYEQGRKRFAEELSTGQLILVHAALISDGIYGRINGGKMRFWVADKLDASGLTCRKGRKCEPVDVPSSTCRRLVSKYGPGLYMKIDVEGALDCVIGVLHSVKYPRFLSVAEGSGHSKTLTVLEDMGYSMFKVVCQRHFMGRSGPFGEQANNALTLPGAHEEGYGFDWSTIDEVRAAYPYKKHAGIDSKFTFAKPHMGCWFDVHARLEDVEVPS